MTPAGNTLLDLPEDYADWLAQFKGQIAQARQRAALAVNAELVRLYGRIGRASCNARNPRAGASRSSTI